MEFVRNRNRIDVFNEVEVSDICWGYLCNSVRRVGSIRWCAKKKEYFWNQKVTSFNFNALELKEIAEYLDLLNKNNYFEKEK